MLKDADKGGGCCAPPVQGLTRLTFFDGTHVQVNGLDAILAAMYAEGRKVSIETAAEIVERLKRKNYISPSGRLEYESAVHREYRKYVESRTCCNAK